MNDPQQTFRERHIADWPTDPWLQLAHETWLEYDREADMREIRQPGYPPKMSSFGLPHEARGGFHKLFEWIVGESYPKAVDLGYTGTPEQWRREVKQRGK